MLSYATTEHVYELRDIQVMGGTDRYPLRLPGMWTNVTYRGRTVCLYQHASRETVDAALLWLMSE